jgi:DNA-binding winged helix-turn-helix (wHTH) protein
MTRDSFKTSEFLSHDQLEALLAAFPDPVFLLTRSGCYAAIYGGTDARYYHDGSGLVGKYLHEVLTPAKTDWFLKEIALALESRSLHIVEYGLAGSDVLGLEDTGPSNTLWFEGRVQALNFPLNGEDAVLWVASNITHRMSVESQLTDALRREREAIDILWRRIASTKSENVEVQWSLDVAGGRLIAASGKVVALTGNEAQLLACLAEAGGAVVPKELVGARLFPGNDEGDAERVTVALSRLRRKLKQQGCRLVIRSVFGKGLALTESVQLSF